MNELPLGTSPRDQTRMKLLGLIRRSGNVTRAELIEATGFSRSTVGHAVSRLIESGLVEEAEPASKGPGSGSGRPGLTLRPITSQNRVAAMDFGHRHVSVGIADASGNELRRATVTGGGDAFSMLDAAAEMVADLAEGQSVEQVVAGIPRPIDRTTGRVLTAHSGGGWDGLLPAEEIERRLGIPTHVENDAVLGAIGERARGSARGFADFLYVKVAHGVGAGLILNGVPYRGSRGIVGDIGHCRIPGRSDLCFCGHRGCLEAITSIGAVLSQIGATHPGEDPQTVLADPDEISERILRDAGRTLGGFVADFCNLMNPAAVIIGGSLGSAHPQFVEGVSWAVSEFSRPMIASSAQVVAAALGADAELVGGLTLAAERAAHRFRQTL